MLLKRIPRAVFLSYTLGRIEVADDATYFEAGLHLDSFGDECGEWFFETRVQVSFKSGHGL